MRPSTSLLTLAVLLAAAAGAACGDNGIRLSNSTPALEVSSGGRPILPGGQVIVSALLPSHVLLKNTGGGALAVSALELVSTPPGAFTLLSTPAAPFDIAAEDEHEITLMFDPSVGGERPTATVHIAHGRTVEGKTAFDFEVIPDAGGPRILVQPSVLDFQTVPAAQSRTMALSILDTGSARLEVTRLFLSGHAGFSVDVGGTVYAASPSTAADGVTLVEPIIIDAGSSATVQVTYTATGAEAAQGQLVLVSNDTTAGNGTVVQLFANVSGPCIKVSPETVDFGGKKVGDLASIDLTIASCGDRDLSVTELAVTDDGGGVYAVDLAALGALPVTVPSGAKITVPVTYLATELAQATADGFSRDLGNLHISSNAYLAEVDVPLTGFGTDGTCPTAVITCTEPDEVAPQTTLHCSAASSTASNGVGRYEWSIIQPTGSAEVIRPSPSSRDITFEANIVGTYNLRLKVYDQIGTVSCSDAEHTIIVTASEGIHVELIWHTPGDIDETDTGTLGGSLSVGSDVDLHFLHENATGWFDDTFDAFWYNPNPNWGGASSNDDPSLDRDDTDGAGPENLNLVLPESNRCYQIGAHYWDDWSYGQSLATVRVYIYGQLRFHWDDTKIVMGDMWDVADVCWPSGAVTAHGSTPQIEHNYDLPPDFGGGGGGDLFCDLICDEFDPFLCPSDCP